MPNAPACVHWPTLLGYLAVSTVAFAVLAAAVDLFEWKARVGGVPVAPMVFAPLLFANTAVAIRLSARKAPPA